MDQFYFNIEFLFSTIYFCMVRSVIDISFNSCYMLYVLVFVYNKFYAEVIIINITRDMLPQMFPR